MLFAAVTQASLCRFLKAIAEVNGWRGFGFLSFTYP
jgi:hypothetical protein